MTLREVAALMADYDTPAVIIKGTSDVVTESSLARAYDDGVSPDSPAGTASAPAPIVDWCVPASDAARAMVDVGARLLIVRRPDGHAVLTLRELRHAGAMVDQPSSRLAGDTNVSIDVDLTDEDPGGLWAD